MKNEGIVCSDKIYSRYKMTVMTSYKLHVHSARNVRIWNLCVCSDIRLFQWLLRT